MPTNSHFKEDQETLRRIERILYNKRRSSRDEKQKADKQFHTAPSLTHQHAIEAASQLR